MRVHKLVPKAVWSERYDLINEFERLLADERHDDPEVLPADLARGAARALQGAARRSGEAMEDQRHRLQGARASGTTTSRPTRRCCEVLDRARALVRDPVEPQVVPQPRGLADHRRHARRPEDEAAEAERRPRRDPQGIRRGGRRTREQPRRRRKLARAGGAPGMDLTLVGLPARLCGDGLRPAARLQGRPHRRRDRRRDGDDDRRPDRAAGGLGRDRLPHGRHAVRADGGLGRLRGLRLLRLGGAARRDARR